MIVGERTMVTATLSGRMSNRSDDRTELDERSPQSTDDLLAETERLLSEADPGAESSPRSSRGGGESEPANPVADERRGAGDRRARATDGSSDRSWSSVLPSAPSALSVRRYFSPRAFLALAVALGVGLFVGGMTIPFAGRVVGLFAVAFAIGLLASTRRYLEMTAAGVSVGAAAALANHAVLAVAGSGRAVVAVGASAGLFACLGGYYFGRDLRDGLLRDVE